jgi:hypothetical protein
MISAAGVAQTKLVLELTAEQDRVLLTHDVATITAHAYRSVMKGHRMPGVFEISRRVSIRSAVEDTVRLTECSNPGEWEGQVRYLPLR